MNRRIIRILLRVSYEQIYNFKKLKSPFSIAWNVWYFQDVPAILKEREEVFKCVTRKFETLGITRNVGNLEMSEF